MKKIQIEKFFNAWIPSKEDKKIIENPVQITSSGITADNTSIGAVGGITSISYPGSSINLVELNNNTAFFAAAITIVPNGLSEASFQITFPSKTVTSVQAMATAYNNSTHVVLRDKSIATSVGKVLITFPDPGNSNTHIIKVQGLIFY